MLSKKYKEITLEGLTVAYYIITSADGFGISVKIFETGESFTAKGISENVLDAVRIADKMASGTVTPETSCQGLFNQIHKKATKKVPEALSCS